MREIMKKGKHDIYMFSGTVMNRMKALHWHLHVSPIKTGYKVLILALIVPLIYEDPFSISIVIGIFIQESGPGLGEPTFINNLLIVNKMIFFFFITVIQILT